MAVPPACPLPVKDGVSPSFVWTPAGNWSTCLDFLVTRFPAISIEIWCERMLRGEVREQQGQVVHRDTPFRAGMCLFYYRELARETEIPFQEHLLYQDEHLLVVDKPHFLPVTPSGRFVRQTLLARLKHRLGQDDLVPIHRIDRETAGLVMFSCRPDTRDAYQSLFRSRDIYKTYEAVAPRLARCEWPLIYRSRIEAGEKFFLMREVAGEPNAETTIEMLAAHGDWAWYRLKPVTGKQHQLRVQMAALGVPIEHDDFYPQVRPCKGDDFSRPLQLLARSLQFTDPVSGEPRQFVSTLKLAGVVRHGLDQAEHLDSIGPG